MFLIVGLFGSWERKIRAAYFFFLYALTVWFYSNVVIDFVYIYTPSGTGADYEIWVTFTFSTLEQRIPWFIFFLFFATKKYLWVPVHLCLLEAYVEASPTAGYVILAGVLLKLGTYGFLRFSLLLFPEASFYFSPVVYTMAVVGIVYPSLITIRQTYFKRIIAYATIAHMNLVMLDIFSFNSIGLEKAVLQSLSHGFVASPLFLIIGGCLWQRHGRRMIKYYGDFAHLMPVYVFIFIFLV